MKDSRPHVLIFIDWFLPGYKAGGPIRSVANLVEALKGKYRFSIVTTDRDLGDEEPYAGIESQEWIEREGYRIWYCSPDHRSYRHIRNHIFEEPFDILYVQSMFSLSFSFFPVWTCQALKPEARVVLAPRGMLHKGALGLKSRKKKLFLWAFRLLRLDKGSVFQATDDQEVLDIQDVFPGSKVEVAENMARPELPLSKMVDKETQKLRIVFLSRITVKKGLDLLLKALLSVKGDVELDLFGAQDEPEYWANCQELISKQPSNVQVNYHGTVEPGDVASTLQSYHAFAMPTLGENFGHAIFEALAAGRPVVISQNSPWRGLAGQKAGWDLPLEVGAFSKALQDLIDMDQNEYDLWSAGARQMAAEYLDRPGRLESYAKLFELPEDTSKNP